MTKDQITESKKIVNFNKPYILYGDNDRLFYGSTTGNHIIWDDTRELCYALRISNEPVGKRRVFETTVIDYTNIQYINQLVDDFQLVDQLNTLKDMQLINNELLIKIKNDFGIK